MKLKIINLHILRYLPTCWLYILERHTIDNQRCTHIASTIISLLSYNKLFLTKNAVKSQDKIFL